MRHRWTIRILFMLPILLCIAAWFWSTNHTFWTGYSHGNRSIDFHAEWGFISLVCSTENVEPDGWTCGTSPMSRRWQIPYPMESHHFLGFFFGWHPGFRGIGMPYWFLILAFTALFYFAWRKTAPRPTPIGFPVEPPAISPDSPKASPQSNERQ
jgi:hypothetical protein